jgi:hypothetical protein
MLPSYTAPATRIVFKGESDKEMSHTRTVRVSIRLSLEHPAAASADSRTNSAEAGSTR